MTTSLLARTGPGSTFVPVHLNPSGTRPVSTRYTATVGRTRMRGIRIVGRGLHDTLEHLLAFAVVSFAWWAGVLLVVTAPPATLALFVHADPRIGTEIDRPTSGETLAYIRAQFVQGWKLALI